MTVTQIEKRLLAVEEAVENLNRRVEAGPLRRWYVTHAGRFANDPVFDEIVRLGAQYRASQRPSSRGKRARS